MPGDVLRQEMDEHDEATLRYVLREAFRDQTCSEFRPCFEGSNVEYSKSVMEHTMKVTETLPGAFVIWNSYPQNLSTFADVMSPVEQTRGFPPSRSHPQARLKDLDRSRENPRMDTEYSCL